MLRLIVKFVTFTLELCDYLQQANKLDAELAYLQANAAVTIVFSAGSDALDCDKKDLSELAQRTIKQLRFIARGAFEFGLRSDNRNESQMNAATDELK